MYKIRAIALVCIHEAAHAVVYALGGTIVLSIEVAPEGATSWSTESLRGNLMTDLLGVCRTGASSFPYLFIKWDESRLGHICDRKEFASQLRQLDSQSRGFGTRLRRAVRASICTDLAGPIADAILDGEPNGEVYLCADACDELLIEDVTKANACSRLLPFNNEFDYLAKETERLLRTPEIWGAVIRLADALEVSGLLQDEILDGLLPDRLHNWPSSPRPRNFKSK